MMATTQIEFDCSEDILRQCVQGMYARIVVESFDPKGNILDCLFQESTISLAEKRRIELLPERRGAELVDMLLECHRPNAIAQFLRILSNSDVYTWIPEEVYKAARENVASRLRTSMGCENNSVHSSQVGMEANESARKKIAADAHEATQKKSVLPSSSFHGNRRTIQTNSSNDSIKEKIRCNYTLIEDNVDPRYEILSKLFQQNILTREELENLRTLRDNPGLCCQKLLDYLFAKDELETSFVEFRKTLQMTHPWIYKMIWEDSDTGNDENRPLPEELKHQIIANISCFTKLIDPHNVNEFLSHLTRQNCTTHKHFETLSHLAKVDKSEMIQELCRILLRRSFAHFNEFKHCLKDTLQRNVAYVLESNGIVLEMHLDMKNKEFEKQVADMLTGSTLKLEHLDERGRTVVEELLKTLERKELIIVGGLFGSLIVFILCMSLNSVNELEKLYKAHYFEATLNTLVANATVRIDQTEFERCRRFFTKQTSIKQFMAIQKQRAFHCFIGGKLNDMPPIVLLKILIRTPWMTWVSYLIESLQPGSPVSLKVYLKNGIHGFSKFVMDSSTNIYHELSSVCQYWQKLLKMRSKSFKSEFSSEIARIAIRESFDVLVSNLHVLDGLLEQSLEKNLINIEAKNYCESLPVEANQRFILCILNRNKKYKFAKFMQFLKFLEEQCEGHLANHVISFGVHLVNFKNKWPLDMQRKLLIVACGDDIIRNMTIDAIPALKQKETGEGEWIERSSQSLVDHLCENNCITKEKRNLVNQLEDTAKKQKVVKLLENGSIEMYKILIDYFEQTGQHDVAQMLQPNQEVHRYGKLIVNCLNRATDIVVDMIEKKKIESSFLNHFSISDHPFFSERSTKFQQNEVVLSVLESSKLDVYIFFPQYSSVNETI